MSVKMLLHPFLNNGEELQVEAQGTNVGECLKDVVRRYPTMKEKLFGKKGELKGYVELLVNSQPTTPLEMAYPVKDGDTVAVLIYLSGG